MYSGFYILNTSPPCPLSTQTGGRLPMKWRGVHHEGFILKGTKRERLKKARLRIRRNRAQVYLNEKNLYSL